MIQELYTASFKLTNLTDDELTLSIPDKPLLQVSMGRDGDQKITAMLEARDEFSIAIGDNEKLLLEWDDDDGISLAPPLNGWTGGNSQQDPNSYSFALKGTAFIVQITLMQSPSPSPSAKSIGIVIVGTVDAP